MTTTLGDLRRTPLFEEHRALGARLVPFAGFEMPVQYAGILQEHASVRDRAGLFDLSHMAQFELRGAGVGAWADALTINHVATMKPGQARYNIFTNERGGCHDDVLFYRLTDNEWLLVVNAANAEKMAAHLSAHPAPDVTVTDRRVDRALIAVQGPRALEIVAATIASDEARAALRAMRYYTCAPGMVAEIPALIARTGYTGEDGFELFVDASDAPRLWRRLLELGAAHDLKPCGLGARDVLRLEAGMPLYGFELGEELSPVAGGQSWALKMEKPAFLGREALAEQLARDEYDRIVGLVLLGRVPARGGYPIFLGDERVGEIRSASTAPSLGVHIATGLVSKKAALLGGVLSVEIRGARHEARVTRMPFYRREK